MFRAKQNERQKLIDIQFENLKRLKNTEEQRLVKQVGNNLKIHEKIMIIFLEFVRSKRSSKKTSLNKKKRSQEFRD